MKKLILFLLLIPALSFGQWKKQVFNVKFESCNSSVVCVDQSRSIIRYNLYVLGREINFKLFGYRNLSIIEEEKRKNKPRNV